MLELTLNESKYVGYPRQRGEYGAHCDVLKFGSSEKIVGGRWLGQLAK